jgi:hypothetical protein
MPPSLEGGGKEAVHMAVLEKGTIYLNLIFLRQSLGVLTGIHPATLKPLPASSKMIEVFWCFIPIQSIPLQEERGSGSVHSCSPLGPEQH